MGIDQFEDIVVDSSQSHADSVRYVAQTFLGDRQYKKLYETLAQKWDRLHSLSAAVRLMQTYGVELSDEDMAALSDKDEAQQINELVSRMPKQSNDQFQHFFLQLQLLVSTAMRVRRALEEGRPDEVAQALEDADATGIATYILRVAVVQAGNEVVTLRNQFDSWIKEADSKMGRLIRGQQDSLAAQKKLAAAQAELSRYTALSNARAAKVVIAFAADDERAFVSIIFNSWTSTSRKLVMERQVEEEYSARLSALENHLTKFKEKQLANSNNMLLKRIQEDQACLVKDVWSIWRREAEDAKFMRESGDKVAALQDKLSHIKASQRENAAKVMASFSSASDAGLKEMALKCWIEEMKETRIQKEIEKEQADFSHKMKALNESKTETTKQIMSMMAGSSDQGLQALTLQGWQKVTEEIRREKVLSETLADRAMKLVNFSDRNKGRAFGAVTLAASALEEGVMIRYLGAWRTWAKMENVMRKHHAMIEGKRQQLVGVQQMFRDFAKQLEGPSKEKTQAIETAPGKSEGKRLSKSQGTTSLPDIHTTGSGRRVKDSPTSKYMSPLQSKGAGREMPEASPHPQPRTAWAS